MIRSKSLNWMLALSLCGGVMACSSDNDSPVTTKASEEKAKPTPREVYTGQVETHNQLVKEINDMGAPSADWDLSKVRDLQAKTFQLESVEKAIKNGKFDAKMVADNSMEILGIRIWADKISKEKNAAIVNASELNKAAAALVSKRIMSGAYQNRINVIMAQWDDLKVEKENKDDEDEVLTAQKVAQRMMGGDIESLIKALNTVSGLADLAIASIESEQAELEIMKTENPSSAVAFQMQIDSIAEKVKELNEKKAKAAEMMTIATDAVIATAQFAQEKSTEVSVDASVVSNWSAFNKDAAEQLMASTDPTYAGVASLENLVNDEGALTVTEIVTELEKNKD